MSMQAPPRDVTLRRAPGRIVWTAMFVLIGIVVVFAGIRVTVDGPAIIAGTMPPEDSFEYRYVAHPWLAYAHILPGIIYLLGAPLQLFRRFRERHFGVHRRLGRILLPLGVTAGVLGVVFGIRFSIGGLLEASAAVVFGSYFVAALVTAFVAIRRGDVDRHRRWMIRAFAVAVAVGTIRIWIGLLQVLGLSFELSFGVACWISFPLHVLAAETYLHIHPNATRKVRPHALQ
jgi:uncharacterized membrane protein YozB (DUF420 family)